MTKVMNIQFALLRQHKKGLDYMSFFQYIKNGNVEIDDCYIELF